MVALTVTATVTDQSGNTAAASAAATITDPVTGPAFGFNMSSGSIFLDGGSETEAQQHTRYLSSYGLAQLPIAKVFYGQLPTSWNTAKEGAVSGRRVIICYAGNTTAANAAAGDTDARVAAHAASVPAGWRVIYVAYQEPEDNLTSAQYKAIYARHLPIIHGQQKPGNRLEMWTCLQAPFQVSGTLASTLDWLPDVVDGFGWDVYLNPFGVAGPTGGTGYGSAYEPTIQTRFDLCIQANKARGVTRWGVMEFGAPWRTWDTGAATRGTKMLGALDWLAAGYDNGAGVLIRPEFLVAFDAKGTNWDQRYRAAGVPATFVQGNPATGPDEPFAVGFGSRIRAGLYAPFTGDPTSI